MEDRLKHRLVGAAVLVSLGVIFIPMVLDNAGRGGGGIVDTNIPPRPEGQFSSRVVPVDEPESTLASEPFPAASVESEGIYGALPLPEAEGEPTAAAPAEAAPPAEPSAAVAEAEPPAAPEPAPQASPAGPVAGGAGAWAVQLGSFSNAQNAIALRDRLRARGYTAFVESSPDTSRSMTRVYVGPELVRSRAVDMLEKLRAETKLKGIVVRYPAG